VAELDAQRRGGKQAQPSNPKHCKKRDQYNDEAREAHRLTHRRALSAAEMDAIEDRMEAIARWRNRIKE
jgi:hypothetical protein